MRTASTAASKATKTDAVSLLKADHRKVEQLFAQFEEADEDEKKQTICKQVCLELIIHTIIEEELFYPACREKKVDDENLDEAQVEHDGAKVLIGDLLQDSSGDQFYEAKVKTLSEYIKHHVTEEEKPRSGIFAKALKAGVDMAALGEKIQARKAELTAQSEALSSRPPQPRSFSLHPQGNLQENSMARHSNDRDRDENGRFISDDDRGYQSRGRGGYRDDDDRGYQSRSQGNYRDRDDQGRFVSDDDERGGSRGRGHGGWYGDSEGHSRAAQERGNEGGSRSRDYDDNDRGSRGGRGHGGWFGDPQGHSQASREGWRHSSHEGSGWYGDPEGHSQASREGWRHSSHEGSGWYGDPQGHSQASREGWDDRGRSGSRSSRSRDYDDDDRGSRGGRGHGGWFGDPQGHSQASREGWRDR
ncbi:MAG TPA: hemerythrin domain-containing protein [Rhizomicrobium sp.]|nr:hemerythrin domain-containing protein [Rhizomicrobium sp.]